VEARTDQKTVPVEDEYMHPLESASNFNESMYFNVYDPATRLCAFVRLGNRPNEQHAEMTVALYLPDGTAAFMYDRPRIESNERFDAAGLRFDVVEPFEHLQVAYTGDILSLADPLVLLDPKSAFAESPRARCSIDLRVSDVAPAWGGELAGDDIFADFWKGHYEAHSHVTGAVTVGDESWAIDGFGLRDHSWGARTWQSIWWYRWLTANFDRDGFVLSLVGSQSGPPRIGGAMLIDGRYEPALDVSIESAWTDDNQLHESLEVRVRTADAVHEISGQVLSMIPLRHRRRTDEGVEVARIGEGLTEWTWSGRTGFGLSEYLDMIVDGRPAGAITS
jgi:hypothetical protein